MTVYMCVQVTLVPKVYDDFCLSKAHMCLVRTFKGCTAHSLIIYFFINQISKVNIIIIIYVFIILYHLINLSLQLFTTRKRKINKR